MLGVASNSSSALQARHEASNWMGPGPGARTLASGWRSVPGSGLFALLVTAWFLPALAVFEFRPGFTRVDELQQALMDTSVTRILLQGDLHLAPALWNTTFFLERDLLIEGQNDDYKATIDFAGLNSVLYIPTNRTLTFHNVRLVGIPPANSNSLGAFAAFPALSASASWPSIIIDVDATAAFNNTEQTDPSCNAPLAPLAAVLTRQNVQFTLSADGSRVTVISPFQLTPPVYNLTTNATLGQARIVVIANSTVTCLGKDTNDQLEQIEPAPVDDGNTGASSSSDAHRSTMKGGTIAGIVVPLVVVAVATAAAAAAVYLWWQRRQVMRRLTSDSMESSTRNPKGSSHHLDSTSSTRAVSSTGASLSTGSHTAHTTINPLHALPAMQYSPYRSLEDTSMAFLRAKACHKARQTSVCFDWHIEPQRLSICKRPDGSNWLLGVGGSGVVYKGVLDDVREVAIKFLCDAAYTDELTVSRFAAEVQVLKACRDPNVVNCLGAWLQKDLTYMVQEVLPRGDLFRALSEDTGRELGWHGRGRQVALDIAQGLFYLHSKNVVHLDIKSPNILFTKDWEAKIGDAGLARLLSKSHLSHCLPVGTFAWTAPELLWGLPVGFSADMWSYAIVLTEICTGAQPERGNYQMPRVPDEAPQHILDLIRECMHQDPSQRPTAKQAILRITLEPQPDAGQ